MDETIKKIKLDNLLSSPSRVLIELMKSTESTDTDEAFLPVGPTTDLHPQRDRRCNLHNPTVFTLTK